ncbi:MAG: hypothetical protein G8237_14425, partial [Magnetococcales bacterium]|nr:hypothetical protein [Magnetococcales bacterium]
GNNSYLVEVTATDPGNLTATRTITVTVANVNEAPSITNNAAISINENTTAVATLTSSDPEGQTVTYSITGGEDRTKFALNGSTLSFITAPDFELPTDVGANNTYSVTITASDGNQTSAKSFTVTVNNVSDSADTISANSSTTGRVSVNGSIVGTVDTDGDRDWFAVTLQAGSTYRIDLMGQAGGHGTLRDPFLYIYNSASDLIGSDDDSGPGNLNSRYTLTPSSSGTYYLAAAAYDNNANYTGTYTLQVTCTSGDPLVLDLDQDGILLTSPENGVLFDMNQDGRREQTGWVGSGDGLLTLDQNRDGMINDIGELVSEYLLPGSGSSLQSLAAMDENRDGRVDGQDGAYSRLQVWRDSDQNGISGANELYGLEQLGILSLGLASQLPATNEIAGNRVTALASFESVNGQVGTMAEVMFSFIPAAEPRIDLRPVAAHEAPASFQKMICGNDSEEIPAILDLHADGDAGFTANMDHSADPAAHPDPWNQLTQTAPVWH